MPQYKGVSGQEIIDSIREGMDFVASLDIGPATNALCTQWQEGDKFVPIASAQTDDELAKAVNSSGATATFALLIKALDFHAERDTAGQGKRVLENIAKWDGDKGARMMMLTESDMEIKDHIASHSKFTSKVEQQKQVQDNPRGR
ncbi:MAG: hypothetical protein FJX23_10175 [Alphaproteobacteria bacterium]|nr:hypothetical protein [Alphaproteobacteria bacterium]